MSSAIDDAALHGTGCWFFSLEGPRYIPWTEIMDPTTWSAPMSRNPETEHRRLAMRHQVEADLEAAIKRQDPRRQRVVRCFGYQWWIDELGNAYRLDRALFGR